jgi:hypothetical protein
LGCGKHSPEDLQEYISRIKFVVMKKKLAIFIAVIHSVTICQAAKNRPDKEQTDAKISDSFSIDWNDSLKAVMALADADLQRNDSASAMNHYEMAYMLAIKANNKTDLIPAGMYIGKQYIKTGRNKAAEVVLEQVFTAAEGVSEWDARLEAADLLAQLFSLRAYYVRANFFLKQTYALREKSSEVLIQKERAKLQAQFDAMVKSKEKEWEQSQKAAHEAAASKEQYIKYLHIGIGALVVFILLLFLRIYSLNKTLFNSEKENDLLIHNKKHTTAELERLHRLNDELRNKHHESFHDA